MLWRMFSQATLGLLVVVEQTMKTLDYPNLISNQLYPYMVSASPTGNRIFQQDNDSFYMAVIVLEGFEEHKDAFQLMSWSLNSMAVNPIEYI